MSNWRVKLEKGRNVWQQKARARELIAQARRAGRNGSACLITNLAQMGDVVLCAGVAAALRERLPQSPLLFACQPRWREVLEGGPVTDGVLEARSLFEVRALARSGLFGTVYVLDLPIPNLLNYLDGVPQIFRYQAPTTGDWFTYGKNLMAFYEQNAGIAEGEARPHVMRRPDDDAVAARLFAENSLDDQGPVFALHTQSSEEAKNWPQENFAALLARWQASHGARFVIVGGPGEAAALAALPGVTHLAGRLTIRQTAAVITRCDMFIGPDSGLAYIAEAVGTPGLMILGATVSATSGPRDHVLFSFVRAADACDPACHRVCTRRPLCVTTLDVDTVDRALQAAWGRACAGRAVPEPAR